VGAPRTEIRPLPSRLEIGAALIAFWLSSRRPQVVQRNRSQIFGAGGANGAFHNLAEGP
jgi:hypothetical protein